MTSLSFSQWSESIEKWKVDSLSKLKKDNVSNKFPFKVGEIVLTYQPNKDHDRDAKRFQYAPFRVNKIEYSGSTAVFVEFIAVSPTILEDNNFPQSTAPSTHSFKASPQDLQIIAMNSCLPYDTILASSSVLFISASCLTEFITSSICSMREVCTELASLEHQNSSDQTAASAEDYSLCKNKLEEQVWTTSKVADILQDVFLILACVIDIIVRSAPTHAQVQGGQDCQVDDLEQPADIELRQKTEINNNSSSYEDKYMYIKVIEFFLCETLRTVNDQLGALLANHPVPLGISIATFVRSIGALYRVEYACDVLIQVIQDCIQTAVSGAVNVWLEPSLQLRTNLQVSVERFVEAGAVAYIEVLHASGLDNVVRQDWSSHSKYMRDRKVTPGLTALCTSLRRGVWDSYRHSQDTIAWGAERVIRQSVSRMSLQWLLTAAVQVCVVYTGSSSVVEQDTTAAAAVEEPENTASERACTVQPSRVRTAQWQRDLGYFASSALQTLAWILTQDYLHFSQPFPSSSNSSSAEQKEVIGEQCHMEYGAEDVYFAPITVTIEGIRTDLTQHRYLRSQCYEGSNSSLPIVTSDRIQSLLQCGEYHEQAEVVAELCLVLRYMLLSVSIAAAEDVEGLLSKLAASTTDSSCSSNSKNGGMQHEGQIAEPPVAVVGALPQPPPSAPQQRMDTAEKGSTAAAVWDGLFELLDCLDMHKYLPSAQLVSSTLQPAATSVNTATAAGVTNPLPQTLLNERKGCFPHARVPHQPYDTTADVSSHTGLYTFHCENAGEQEIYEDFLKIGAVAVNASNTTAKHSNTAIFSAQSNIYFARISNTKLKNTQQLYTLLQPEEAEHFYTLYQEIHDCSKNLASNTAKLRYNYIKDMLHRRYELIDSSYPPLTAMETQNNERILSFLGNLNK